MGWIRKIFSYFLSQMAAQYAIGQVKRKAILVYLKTLQAMRKSILLGLLIFCFIQMMVIGFFGSVVTAIFLLPQDTDTKLYILLGFFGFLFMIPFVGLCIMLSEKMWYRFSGTEKLLEKI